MNEQSIEIKHTDRIVGLFISVALIITIGGFIFKIKESGGFVESYQYFTTLQTSYGIAKQSTVKMSGITIGEVVGVDLLDDGRVNVNFILFGHYRKFMTQGSQLEIASSIGLASVIGGTGLTFIHNPKSKIFIKNNSFIKTTPPLEFDDIIKKFELEKMATSLKNIVWNVEAITSKLKQDQLVLSSAMVNVEQISKNISMTTQNFPKLAKNMEQSLVSLNHAINNVDNMLSSSTGDVTAMMKNLNQVSSEVNVALKKLVKLITQVQVIVKQIEKSATVIPGIVIEGKELIENSVELTEKLKGHWLLGQPAPSTFSQTPSIHQDSNIYKRQNKEPKIGNSQ